MLSDLHAALGEIERVTDAARLNAIVNHPDVRPAFGGEGDLDTSPLVENPANVLLLGEYGGVMFVRHQPGLYEAHTQILPAGRGRWAVRIVRAALHWMFSRTAAAEIFTRCPSVPARALARAIGGKRLFTNAHGWRGAGGEPIPADIFTLTVQDWIADADGLPERGHWFHEKLEEEYRRLGRADPRPHEEDDVHDRYVGAACEMFLGGQPEKAVTLYNRWAVMADYEPVAIVTRTPLTIDIRDAIILVSGNDFWVATCRSPQH